MIDRARVRATGTRYISNGELNFLGNFNAIVACRGGEAPRQRVTNTTSGSAAPLTISQTRNLVVDEQHPLREVSFEIAYIVVSASVFDAFDGSDGI